MPIPGSPPSSTTDPGTTPPPIFNANPYESLLQQDSRYTAGFFANLHIPLPKFNALLTGCTECFGGTLLLLGLAARLASLPLTIVMIVAFLIRVRCMSSLLSPTPRRCSRQTSIIAPIALPG